LIAGVIYSAVVFQAVVKRSEGHHVQPHTTH
jgi:hypothetical protein